MSSVRLFVLGSLARGGPMHGHQIRREAQTDRTELRSSLEDVDVTQAYTELSKTMTILTATQTSFSKLSQLSLFNYLR